MDILRRPLGEFITRARLTSQFGACIVEGDLDKRITEQVFIEAGIRTQVFKISEITIDIVSADLKSVENGNKGRLIELSRELEKNDVSSYHCIIDIDVDEYLGIDYSSNSCRYHQFLSIDWYALNKSKLKRLIAAALKSPMSDEQLMALMEDSLFITCLRAFRDSHDVRKPLPKLKGLFDDTGRISREKYLIKFAEITKIPAAESRAYVNSKEIKGYRKQVHFKDFMSVFLEGQKSIRAFKSSMGEPKIRALFLGAKSSHNYRKHKFWKQLVDDF